VSLPESWLTWRVNAALLVELSLRVRASSVSTTLSRAFTLLRVKVLARFIRVSRLAIEDRKSSFVDLAVARAIVLLADLEAVFLMAVLPCAFTARALGAGFLELVVFGVDFVIFPEKPFITEPLMLPHSDAWAYPRPIDCDCG
jgi:hypothetical protein